jgi:hypothetical protein
MSPSFLIFLPHALPCIHFLTLAQVTSGLVEVGRAGCDSQIVSSTTTKSMAGGTLYVTKSANPSGWTHAIDLGDAAINAGCAPKHKPHMAV